VELIVMSGRHKQLWEEVVETKVGTKKAIANRKHWVHLRLVEEERKDARESEKESKKEKKGTTAMLVEQGLINLDEIAELNYGCGEDGFARQHLLLQSLAPGLTEGHTEHGERIIMEGGKLKTKAQQGTGKRTIAQLLALEEEDEDKFSGYGEHVDEALNKLLLQIVEVDRKTTNNHRKMGAHVGELAQRLDTMNSKTENLSLNMQTVRDDIRHMRESIKLIAENTKKTQQIVKLY
jgi:methyl-accepting chemotaxis protein